MSLINKIEGKDRKGRQSVNNSYASIEEKT